MLLYICVYLELWSRSAGITAVIRGMVPSYCYIMLYKFTLWFGDNLVYTDHHFYIKHIHAVVINTHTVCTRQTNNSHLNITVAQLSVNIMQIISQLGTTEMNSANCTMLYMGSVNCTTILLTLHSINAYFKIWIN